MPALTLLLMFTLANLLFLAGATVVFEGLGNRAVEIRLFYGPKVFSVSWRGRTFSVGILPLGGYVQPERPPFMNWEFGKSSLPPIAAVTILVLVGVGLLGPTRAWAELIAGFQQFISGTFSPLATGKVLCGNILKFMKEAPLPLAFGMVAIKIAATSFVPAPTGPLGAILFHGIGKLLRLSTRTMEYLQLVGALAMFLALGCWIVALLAYLASGNPST